MLTDVMGRESALFYHIQDISQRFHDLVARLHPTGKDEGVENRALSLEAISHMFSQNRDNHVNYRFSLIFGQGAKAANDQLYTVWQTTIVQGVKKHASTMNLSSHSADAYIAYCTDVCSTWSGVLHALAVNLELPQKQFKDYASLSLPYAIDATWRNYVGVVVPHRAVGQMLHEMLRRYVDAIARDLTDVWEHVTIGDSSMDVLHHNPLWDILVPIVDITRAMRAALEDPAQSLPPDSRSRYTDSVTKRSVADACSIAVMQNSYVMSWFLGNFWSIHKGLRLTRDLNIKYASNTADGGRCLNWIMMILSQLIIASNSPETGHPLSSQQAKEADVLLHAIQRQVDGEYYTAHQADPEHAAPFSIDLEQEAMRRFEQQNANNATQSSFASGKSTIMASLLALIQKRRQQEKAEAMARKKHVPRLGGLRLPCTTRNTVTAENMLPLLQEALQQSSLFMNGCAAVNWLISSLNERRPLVGRPGSLPRRESRRRPQAGAVCAVRLHMGHIGTAP